MNSMTGFGRGQASGSGVTVTVEMKSVNNRFRDLQLRCPREYMAFEPRVSALLKPRFGRGRIDVFIRRTSTSGGIGVSIDEGMATTYVKALMDLGGKLNLANDLSVSSIAAMPGVLSTVEQQPDVSAEWAVLETAVEAAADHLAEMREREGEATRESLTKLFDELADHRQRVVLEADGVASRLRLKLMDRLNKLVADRVDADRLAQEAAILADKADISEELDRLDSHIKQARAAMKRNEPVGRRLDFLAQELNREINTIGSKAAEHAVSALVVDMKSTLERVREQVANVE
jgi:uncharacterized protein (TIGR00255 family)